MCVSLSLSLKKSGKTKSALGVVFRSPSTRWTLCVVCRSSSTTRWTLCVVFRSPSATRWILRVFCLVVFYIWILNYPLPFDMFMTYIYECSTTIPCIIVCVCVGGGGGGLFVG